MKIIKDEWQSCYPSQWKGIIVPEATKHPAKFSSKLIRHIYDHMTQEGWLQPGDIVLDPFGGVALGALDAMLKGIRWVGVELEPKFADIGQQNIRLWNKRFHPMPHWNSDSKLLNGDSRMLLQVLQQHGISVDASTAVMTPPYADSMERKGGFDPEKSKHAYGPNSQMANSNTGYSDVAGSISSPPWTDNLANDGVSADERRALARSLGISNAEHISPIDMEKVGKRPKDGYAAGMISSPPYSEARIGQESGQEQCGRGDQYGATEGQLGSMKADGFDDVISSPPFGDMVLHDGGVVQQQGGELHSDYGQSEGQLGSMKADGFDDVISSPPFIQARGGTPEPKPDGTIDAALYQRHSAGNAAANGYGDTEGQLSSMRDDGFNGALSSPPYKTATEGQGLNINKPATFRGVLKDGSLAVGHSDGQLADMPDGNFDGAVTSPPYEGMAVLDFTGKKPANQQSYSSRYIAKDVGYNLEHDENLGSNTGDSFWLAARQIVYQTYLALRPGGHAVWVVKAFVKDKAIVDFPNQWRLLCESVGFVTLHEHHAMLTNHKGTSHTLEGGDIHHKTEAKSFFRRNGENKARAEAWWNACDLTRDQKAKYLRCAHEGKWLQWHTDVEKYHDRPIKPPKAFIIRGKAQMMAWEDAGSPDVEIATSIDYETVFCMVKPVEA